MTGCQFSSSDGRQRIAAADRSGGVLSLRRREGLFGVKNSCMTLICALGPATTTPDSLLTSSYSSSSSSFPCTSRSLSEYLLVCTVCFFPFISLFSPFLLLLFFFFFL